MKKALFVSVMTCVAGLASAAEVNWVSQTGVTTGAVHELDSGAHIAPATGYTAGALRFTATFTKTADTYGGSLLSFGDVGKVDHVGSSPTLWLDKNTGKIRLGIGGNEGAGTGLNMSALVDGQAHEFVMAIERLEAGKMSVAVFVDGVKIYSLDDFGVDGGGWWTYKYTLGTKLNLADTETLKGATLSDITVDFAQGATIQDITDMYAIPEPTALALLALGVAGLALRRKVA